MTVAELIDELRKMPLNAEIVIQIWPVEWLQYWKPLPRLQDGKVLL